MYKVNLDKIEKALKKLPDYIVVKLRSWAQDVELYGLPKVKEVPGYHDEALKGKLQGLRSIKLSKGYRAIYKIENTKTITMVIVEEVNKHEYKK